MKKFSYKLYKAIKLVSSLLEESLERAEALELAIETGYGLLDGSISWEDIPAEELDLWVEGFESECVEIKEAGLPTISTLLGELYLSPEYDFPDDVKGAMRNGFSSISVYTPNFERGWEELLERELEFLENSS